MKKSEAIKAIDKAFYRLSRCCESLREWEQYVDMLREDERRHRRFCPNGTVPGLPLGKAVELFAVKNIFGRFVSEPEHEKIFTPEAKDFFTIRRDIFAACAIADMKGERILQEFPCPEMLYWLTTIDYSELMK